MKFYFKINIFLIIFFASWTSAFAIDWFTIPTCISVFTLFNFIVWIIFIDKKIVYNKIKIDKEDTILLFLLLCLILISLIKFNGKTSNYLFAYCFTFLFSYGLNKYVILKYSTLKFLLNVNLFTIIFVSVFGSADFLLQVLYSFRIQDLIPRNVPSFSIFGALGFPRNTGFCEEPTYFAWYYNCLGLIAVWHLFKTKIWLLLKIVFTTIILFSYLVTFSSAGIPFLIVFASFYTLLFSKKRFYFIIGLFLTAFLLITIAQIDDDFDLIAPIFEKLSLEGESGEDRNDNWIEGWAALKENPVLGKGLGYYSSIKRQSFLNYYLFLSTEVGIIPTVLFCIFLFMIFQKIWRYKGDIRTILLISFSCGAAHLLTQSSFYMPYFWLMIIFINKFNSESKKSQNHEFEAKFEK